MGTAREALSEAVYACGECVNCRLNAANKKSKKQTRRKRSSVDDASSSSSNSSQQQQRRRCIRYNEYTRNQMYESIELGPECIFKMRRRLEIADGCVQHPRKERIFQYNAANADRAIGDTRSVVGDHRETERNPQETQSRPAQGQGSAPAFRGAQVRRGAFSIIQFMKSTPANGVRRTAIDYSHVDSDVFDSFSEQLLPDIIRRYVQGFAAAKLQQSVRDFLRSRRWKLAWQDFKDGVQLVAVVTIQTASRMLRDKQTRRFLEEVRQNHHMEAAAATICRFFRAVLQQRHARVAQLLEEARHQAKQRQRDALLALENAGSVVTIQCMYRGFWDRLQWKRIRLLNALSPQVRTLVDYFFVPGNFWGFVLEIDAAYRRFEHDKRVEDEDALTFVSTLLRQRKREEDQMMQEWFAASAMQSPIVHGAHQAQSTYLSASPASSPTESLAASSADSSLSQALLESPMATDLIALSPNKRKAEVFPTDLPPKVIRHAMAQGFAFGEIIATMRGLQAKKEDIHDVHLVVKALAQRTPLMTNPWKSEWQVRHEAHPRYNVPGDEKNNEDDWRHAKRSYAVQKQKPMLGHHVKKASKNPALRKQPEPFVSKNLVAPIPGGLNAPIARILFVVALKSFDPDADGGDGAFTLPEDFTIDPFQSYLQLESPLLKAMSLNFRDVDSTNIRREHQALQPSKPFLALFTENRCFTGYDVLYNVRGVDELALWKISKPLALSIYDVLEQTHRQITHLSTRNIQREMFISSAFEQFFHARVSDKMNKPRQASTTTTSEKVGMQCNSEQEAHHPLSPAVVNSPKDQIRERLDRDVLIPPIQDARMDAVDVLFKAVFLVCDAVGSYEAFLDSLAAFQSQEDFAGLQQVIRDRVDMTKHVAGGYAAALQASGVTTASDLLVTSPNHVIVRITLLTELLVFVASRSYDRGWWRRN
ncbi:hypothetical protein FI667_g1746, partial [Globisporangium splendens]